MSSLTNYEKMTVVQLKELARSQGLRGYSKLRKAELIELLSTQVGVEEKKLSPIPQKSLASPRKFDDKQMLSNWLSRINCQTPFNQIPESQYVPLMKVYGKRINNYPVPEVIQSVKQEFPNFDIYIFFAKVHFFKAGPDFKVDPADILSDSNLFDDFDSRKISKWIFENMNTSTIRKGDVVCFSSKERRFRNDYSVIFNGNNFQHLEDKYDEYNHLPHDFHIQDYPGVHYFQNHVVDFKEQAIAHNNIVWLWTVTDQKPVLISTIGKVKKYKTADNYIVYTTKEDFIDRYENENEIEVVSTIDNFIDFEEESFSSDFSELVRADFKEESKHNVNILFYVKFFDE